YGRRGIGRLFSGESQIERRADCVSDGGRHEKRSYGGWWAGPGASLSGQAGRPVGSARLSQASLGRMTRREANQARPERRSLAPTAARLNTRQGQSQFKNGTNMEQKAILDGDPAGVEIVAEVRREEALLKTGALQNAIFNSANFSSIATDAKGVIQIFNVGAERMQGYTAGEVMNKITPADISDPQEVIARATAL